MGYYEIGQSVPREEDPRLLRGNGRYVDDVRLPHEARGLVLRSPHAHAKIASIDVRAANQLPGVLAIFTGDDLRARGLGTLRPAVPRKRSTGAPAFVTPQPLLAQGKVRFVGEPVVFIVADTLDQAKDAAERVAVEYEALPVLIDPEAALAPGAPALWEDNPGNEAFCHEAGDKASVEAAIAKADHVVRHKIVINRITANSMEPRGCVAQYDAEDDRYTIRCTIQSTHGTRAQLADRIFKVPHTKVRVICDNMGGGFGMKGGCSPEYALSMWAAEVTGRPVRWIAERSEGLLSDEQSRGSVIDTELALDKSGKFLGLRTTWRTGIGAYFTNDRAPLPITVALGCLVNTYALPAVYARVYAALTNTMTIAPYRGGGRPEPLFVTETIIDKAARVLGMSPEELRRRNTIPASAMPYTTSMRQIYDSGDFIKNLDDAKQLSDYSGLAARRAEAKKRGKLLGVGVATAVAATGGRDFEHAEIRFDPSGGITLITGSMDHGQGHGTTFKQILSEKLNIDADRIRYRYGDTDVVTNSIGTFGSRSAMLAGSAVVLAAERIVERGKKIAAHMMEASAGDIVFEKGGFAIAGTDRKVTMDEVVKRSFDSADIPRGLDPGFSERADYGPPGAATFPSGAHICEVEIDEDTGKAELVRYAAVDDVGTMLNPLLCHGQIHGGIAQGIGQALLEDMVYDKATGQVLTGSFQDYCMPRADDFCAFKLGSNVSPSNRNPLGVKGVGEAGTIGAIPAVMNAVNDALAQVGAASVEMPAAPEKLWRAIQAARG
ncbi:MAG TPA: xanthine dehydrogenase family protein molybdopterin-binding subunit [Stellaceae bacterium]|nr:xanthine dehydrogenase family protein molybdopterin-binding subunit [Stellaceae bacterium]